MLFRQLKSTCTDKLSASMEHATSTRRLFATWETSVYRTSEGPARVSLYDSVQENTRHQSATDWWTSHKSLNPDRLVVDRWFLNWPLHPLIYNKKVGSANLRNRYRSTTSTTKFVYVKTTDFSEFSVFVLSALSEYYTTTRPSKRYK